MNDHWTEATLAIAESASAELASALAGLAALPVHSPTHAALAARTADLRHSLAAARQVLDATPSWPGRKRPRHEAPPFPSAALPAAATPPSTGQQVR